jgi:hypothetical protein
MAVVPVPAQVVPGSFITAALWNANVYGPMNFVLAPVRFKGYSSTTQSLATGSTAIALTLDTELYDSDGAHSTVTNTSRFTAQTPGLMSVTGSVCIANTNTTGTRTICVLLNGVVVAGSMVQAAPSTTNGTTVQTTTDVQVAVGDYVEIGAWQNSGVALLTTANAGNLGTSTTMTLRRISN